MKWIESSDILMTVTVKSIVVILMITVVNINKKKSAIVKKLRLIITIR
jgi:hypothetical protein